MDDQYNGRRDNSYERRGDKNDWFRNGEYDKKGYDSYEGRFTENNRIPRRDDTWDTYRMQ